MTGQVNVMSQALQKVADREGKYLTFSLDREEYGIRILRVKEIIGIMRITPIPQTPEYMKGVINLRGKVIPVIDLRARFGMDVAGYVGRKCIIVMEASSSEMGKCWIVKKCDKTTCPGYDNNESRCWMISGTHCRDEIQGSFHQKIEACRKCSFFQTAYEQKSVFTVGIMVDSVSEVINIKGCDIEDTPAFGTALNTEYIQGMAKMSGGVKILLDIDKVFSTDKQILLLEAA